MEFGFKGLALAKSFESLKLKSYKDLGGIWTIGYGTTKLNGYPVSSDMEINEAVATALFLGGILDAAKVVNTMVTVTLTQDQFDALVDFTYNLGAKAFMSSSLLASVNNKMLINEDLFTRWNKFRDPLSGELKEAVGLTRRRKAEYKLYIGA